MRMAIVLLTFFFGYSLYGQLDSHVLMPSFVDTVATIESTPLENLERQLPKERKESKRAVAALLTLTLGPLGAHRIYLGTDVKVPVFYTITLGGGLGILPVIDLLHILLSKDLSRFEGNPRIVMWWGKSDE